MLVTIKGGGGLTIYYRESLSCHQHHPTVPSDYLYLSNERQWLMVSSGTRKLAILHCYLACVSTSRSNDFLRWNRDLFTMMADEVRHLRRLGFVCLCMGECLVAFSFLSIFDIEFC